MLCWKDFSSSFCGRSPYSFFSPFSFSIIVSRSRIRFTFFHLRPDLLGYATIETLVVREPVPTPGVTLMVLNSIFLHFFTPPSPEYFFFQFLLFFFLFNYYIILPYIYLFFLLLYFVSFISLNGRQSSNLVFVFHGLNGHVFILRKTDLFMPSASPFFKLSQPLSFQITNILSHPSSSFSFPCSLFIFFSVRFCKGRR